MIEDLEFTQAESPREELRPESVLTQPPDSVLGRLLSALQLEALAAPREQHRSTDPLDICRRGASVRLVVLAARVVRPCRVGT